MSSCREEGDGAESDIRMDTSGDTPVTRQHPLRHEMEDVDDFTKQQTNDVLNAGLETQKHVEGLGMLGNVQRDALCR